MASPCHRKARFRAVLSHLLKARNSCGGRSSTTPGGGSSSLSPMAGLAEQRREREREQEKRWRRKYPDVR
nr:unnamed protein product [Digitaria exilis]